MAILRGEQGAVQFDAAGSSNATIVGTRSWTLNITKDTLDVTDHGDTARAFVGSLVSGSGTDSVSFAGIITSMDIASTAGDLVVATCNFVTSGTITSNLE